MKEAVLIIENDPDARELTSMLFEREGLIVYTASDGAEGVALAEVHKPDVIVCDLLMDRMDGFRVLQLVRALPEGARAIIVVVSAKSFKPDIDRAKELGADAYLVKPIVPDDLLAAVRRARQARTVRKLTVKFWGTRGSIAAPGPGTNVYGGNTSCVEVRVGDAILIFDAGTGIRELGLILMKEFRNLPLTVHLFISHTHWDHIQGFPFFMPAYSPAATIHLYGAPGPGRSLERLLAGQMNPDYFPVALGDLAAKIQVHEFQGANFQIGDIAVAATYLNHPGMTLGYKILCGEKAIVYATDNEQYTSTLEHVGQRAEAGREFGQRLDEAFVSFVSQADLYIGEAQYTDAEYPRKIGWGHSPLSATVDVALKAGAKALALFHHDPMHSDDVIAQMETEAQRLVASRGGTLRCFAAREGQTLEI